jgi:hypothetical protein
MVMKDAMRACCAGGYRIEDYEQVNLWTQVMMNRGELLHSVAEINPTI